MKKDFVIRLIDWSVFLFVLTSASVQAQIVPDNTLPDNSVATPQGDDVTKIDGGTVRGNNLFHSFQDFSVSDGGEAFFNNANTISNILSRVTGGNISNIDGSLRANGNASLFLINPAGIIFGSDSSLNLGGSFIGSTADSIIFPDGLEFSATNTQTEPLLTISTPAGLGFKDQPGDIINRAFSVDGDDFIGLRVSSDDTLALIGGNVSLEELGTLSTNGGRIELGSVGGDSMVSLTKVEKGWDVGYAEIEQFQDISLSGEAFIYSFGENTGDIQVQGRNITLTEGSEIIIDTESGQAGNLDVVATDSIRLEQTPDVIPTLIINDTYNDATGEGSRLTITADRLEIQGGQIGSETLGSGNGVDVEIIASEIELSTNEVLALIVAQVNEEASGDSGNITIETEELTLNQGAQINTSTFGAGNGGDLSINASESIQLIGTSPESNNPSGLFANVEQVAAATGNGGELTINTSRLVVKDGAQIATVARNQGDGGNLNINASESIVLSSASTSAEFQGGGRSGIFVSVDPSFEDEFSGAIIPSVGNGGQLSLTTKNLTIEDGAFISADTFSLGNGGIANINVNKLLVRNGGEIGAGSIIGANAIDSQRGLGGTLNISATDSVEVSGVGDINGQFVSSSLFTLAQSNGNAGNLSIFTPKLTVSNSGNINASAIGSGVAGSLSIDAQDVDLDSGSLTAETRVGNQGNIILDNADTLLLRNNSQITTNATELATGGDIFINSEAIAALDNSDITANAVEGRGGNIQITTQGIFQEPDSAITAASELGIDGTVTFNTPDVDPAAGIFELPDVPIDAEGILAQDLCKLEDDKIAKGSSFIITGRGGLTPTSEESLSDRDRIVNWASREDLEVNRNSTVGIRQREESDTANKTYPEIKQSQGLVVAADGSAWLTANAHNTVPQGAKTIHPDCRTRKSAIRN